MAKALFKDVSLQELQQMREDGMTNAEIAEQLDVHVSTIYKHLGKQPDGMRRTPRAPKAPQVHGEPHPLFVPAPVTPMDAVEPQPTEGLHVISRCTQLDSSAARYLINNDSVRINIDDAVLVFTKDEFDAWVNELLEVLSMM